MTTRGRTHDGLPETAAKNRRGFREWLTNDALFAAILFACALAPRLLVALAFAGEAVWDGHYYDFGARRIAAGLGYSDDRWQGGRWTWHPWCHYPVGYSAFLAFFYRIFGATSSVAAVANALVGAALAVVTWAVAREGLSSARARAAAWIVAFHPGLVLYAALVMSEPLAALLTLLSFWLMLRFTSKTGFAAAAAMLGAAALVRPQALLCGPFMGLKHKTLRRRVVGALAACFVALLVVLPWTIRNCRVMDGCALVSTNAGWNLAIGAFPRATGRFETLRSSDGCRDVTGQVQQDRCWLKYEINQIRAHPAHWLSLVPSKLGFTFDHESFAVEYLHEARPDLWSDNVRSWMRGMTTLAHRLLLAAASLGVVAFPLQRNKSASAVQGALLVIAALLGGWAVASDASFWPLVVFMATVGWLSLPGAPPRPLALLLPISLIATTLIAHAIFFGEDRYHVVVIPVLALLAAAALRAPEGRQLASAHWNGQE